MLSEEQLNNTKWLITHEGKSNVDPDIFTFNSNMSVSVQNKSHINSTWTVIDGVLIIKYNNSYVEYRGTLVGHEIVGKAKNIKNYNWDINLTRLSPLREESKTRELKVADTNWYIKISANSSFNIITDEGYLILNNGGTASIMRKNGVHLKGSMNWVLEDNRITINVNESVKYIGKISNHSIVGQLSIKGKRRFFYAVKRIGVIPNSAADISINTTVFTVEKYNDSNKIHFLDYYQKYWIGDEKNPAFDTHSGNILNLKKNENNAISHFYGRLNPLISTDELVICYVPSSDPENEISGVRKLCSMLAKVKNRIDGTHCIIRHKKINKLAHGGDRSISVHLTSLQVQNTDSIKGKMVLLLDDVTTTGNSLEACKRLLINAGAIKVYCFALGQTS